jgi:hypothetical protein
MLSCPCAISGIVPIDLSVQPMETLGHLATSPWRWPVKRFVIAALVAAFGATVVLPVAAIVGAFAAETKKRAKKKKPAKKYKKPAKKAPTQT